MTTSELSAPPLPRRIQLEVTAACNLRCRMCLVRYRPTIDRVTGSLAWDTFCDIIDHNPQLEELVLQGLGEPLLAPRLVEMVAHAAGRGIRVGFNTNGTLLTRAKASALIDAGLDWLHVSLDGATAETYESIRDGASFVKVTSNIAQLVALKRKHRSDRPHLQLVFVAMKRNVEELPELVRLAAAWEVEAVWVQNLSHSFEDTGNQEAYSAIRQFTEREALWASNDG